MNLPAAENAVITATRTSSPAEGARFSNDRKNGTQHSNAAAAVANQKPFPPDITAPKTAAAATPAAARTEIVFSLIVVPALYSGEDIVHIIA